MSTPYTTETPLADILAHSFYPRDSSDIRAFYKLRGWYGQSWINESTLVEAYNLAMDPSRESQ